MKGINVYFEDIKRFKIRRKSYSEWIERIIIQEKYQMGSITLIFCSDEYIIQLNRKYLHHNYHTDIITFDYSTNHLISGDLFIGVEQVRRNAIEFKQPFDIELSRVIFHGILHLTGYDDKTKEDTLLMRKTEHIYLNQFNII